MAEGERTSSDRVVAAPVYQRTDDLWLVTTFFNPAGYHRKRAHYELFRDRIQSVGLQLLTVECAFGEQPFSLPASHDVLQLRTGDVLWQKERLLNTAIATLPARCTKVAWLDCDILFANPAWAVEAADQLERYPLVQLFDRAILLPPDARAYDGSAGKAIAGFATAIAANRELASSGDWDAHGHTGYAWAARRELITRHGLYDRFILGGADHAMAHAFADGLSSMCVQRRWRVNSRHQTDFESWAEAFRRDLDGSIGAVGGTVLHLWHGTESDRRYEQRHRDLADAGFDPRRDLRVGSNGCWEWASDNPKIRRIATDYFAGRKEDAAEDQMPAPVPPEPGVSVIVPVYNGAASIAECLSSLVALDYPLDRLELLCVDNGSTDETVALVDGFAPRVRLLREPKRGAAAARNCGVRAARFDRIAFTDADCQVEPLWLRHLVAPLIDPKVGIVGGRILARPPANFVERFGEVIHDHRRAIDEFRPPYAITMSWASRRDLLIDVGLFDERLLRGQDGDLAYRIGERGFGLVYVDEAIVYHRNERNLRGLFHEGYTHGYHAPRIRALHAQALALPGRAEQLRRALRRALRSQPPAGADWRQRLCARVFNLGKLVGELHGLTMLSENDGTAWDRLAAVRPEQEQDR